MQIIERIKACPMKIKFRVASGIYIGFSIMILILLLTSLGMAGSTFMVWNELQTPTMRQYIKQNNTWFFVTMQCLIAFDVLFMATVILLLYSVFNFYTKGNFIILIIAGIFGVLRWGFGLWFIIASKSSKLVSTYEIISSSQGQKYCQQSCSQFFNYINCQKILMWGQLHSYQIGLLVILSLIGVFLGPLGKWVNEQDVKMQEGSMTNIQQ